MFVKAWQWAKAQNLYVLAASLGLFGMLDAVTPGPRADHLMGLAIALVAAFIWGVQ